MKIRTLTRLTSLCAVVVFAALLLAGWQMLDIQQQIVASESNRFKAYNLAEGLRQSSEELTRLARGYVTSGDAEYMARHARVLAVQRGQEPRPEQDFFAYNDLAATGERISMRGIIRRMPLSVQEFALLDVSLSGFDAAVDMENQVLMQGASSVENSLFGPRYLEQKTRVMEPVNGFLRIVNARTNNQVAALNERQHRFQWLALLLSLGALVGVVGVGLITRRMVVMPLVHLERQAEAIAQGEYSTRCDIRGKNELAVLGRDFNVMAEAIERDIVERKQVEASLRASEERWNFALQGSVEGVWDWDNQSQEMQFSKGWKEMLGFAEDEIGSDYASWKACVHPEDLPRVLADVQANIEGRTDIYSSEYRVQSKDGRWKWVLDRGMVVSRDAEGRALRMIGTHADVTERREREEALRLAAIVINTVDEAVMVTGADNLIVAVNPAFTRITGYAEAEVIGKNPNLLSSGSHPPVFFKELWTTLVATGSWRGEIRNRRKNGELYVEWLSIKLLRDERGHLINHLAVFSDISARKAEEERINHLAHYDGLTDLPNRTLITDRLRQALSKAKRDRTRMGLMFIDLDKFKPVNDNLGHAVGDLLLVEVANRLRDNVRASDTVARLGGDEFVVLLPTMEQEEDAVMVAEKIRYALNQPFQVAGHVLNISSSIGVAVYPEHGADEKLLLIHADIAMYHAKKGGRDAVRLYRPTMFKESEDAGVA